MGASKIDELVKVKKRSKGNGFVKSSAGKARKSGGVRRTQVYAATTKDEAQRSIRTFYEVVRIFYLT
jgi:hypothetical protein